MMTDDRAPVFIDTNVLLRFAIRGAPQHRENREAIQRLWAAGMDLWISRQILREFASVLTRPQSYAPPLTSAEAVAELRVIQGRFLIADETAVVTEQLIALLEAVPVGGKQVHDANIVATMRAYGIGQLLTLNAADFRRFTPLIAILAPEEVLR